MTWLASGGATDPLELKKLRCNFATAGHLFQTVIQPFTPEKQGQISFKFNEPA